MIFAVEHVRNGARGLRPHGSEGVGIAGLRQIPTIEGVAGAGCIRECVILIDLERLLACEWHIVQTGRTAVRVDHDGRINVEAGVLTLGFVIVIIENIIRFGRALLCPHGGKGVGITGLCQIPAVELIAGAGRVGERVIPVDPERLLRCKRHGIQPGRAAVRIDDDGRIRVEAGIFALGIIKVIVEDVIRVRLTVLRPHGGKDGLAVAVIGFIPTVELVAGAGRVIERRVLCHVQHCLSVHVCGIQIGCATVRVDGHSAAIGKRLFHDARIIIVIIGDLDVRNRPSGCEAGPGCIILPADRLLRALVGERQRAGTRDCVAAGSGDLDIVEIGLGAAVQVNVDKIACVDRDLPFLLVARIVVGDLTGRHGIAVDRIQNRVLGEDNVLVGRIEVAAVRRPARKYLACGNSPCLWEVLDRVHGADIRVNDVGIRQRNLRKLPVGHRVRADGRRHTVLLPDSVQNSVGASAEQFGYGNSLAVVIDLLAVGFGAPAEEGVAISVKVIRTERDPANCNVTLCELLQSFTGTSVASIVRFECDVIPVTFWTGGHRRRNQANYHDKAQQKRHKTFFHKQFLLNFIPGRRLLAGSAWYTCGTPTRAPVCRGCAARGSCPSSKNIVA